MILAFMCNRSTSARGGERAVRLGERGKGKTLMQGSMRKEVLHEVGGSLSLSIWCKAWSWRYVQPLYVMTDQQRGGRGL